MNVEEINRILIEKQPDRFMLGLFRQTNRELVVGFAFEGGEDEDNYFIVKFTQAVIFHVPSVLHGIDRDSIIFKIAPHKEAHKYIPSISFDEEEFGDKGYKIFLLNNSKNIKTGYYIAAECVESEWATLEKGRKEYNLW
ncbi:MAG: hypothetical protein ABII74_10600 [Elusimicrobiota bacterium]